MQELAIAQNLAITSCKDVLQGFDNDGVQKQRSSLFIWTENASVQTKNCVAALSMMALTFLALQYGKCGQPFLIELNSWKFV